MTGMQWLLVGVMLVTAGSLVLAGILQSLSSSDERSSPGGGGPTNRAIAERLGFAFSSEADANSIPAVRVSRLGLQGRSHRVTNVLRGTIDGDAAITVFDFLYVGDDDKANRQTIAAFRVPGLDLPAFEIEPKPCLPGYRTKSSAIVPSAGLPPDFLINFQLYGKNPQVLEHLFDVRTASLLSLKKGWFIEGEGFWLVVYRHGSVASPSKRESFIEKATSILRIFRS